MAVFLSRAPGYRTVVRVGEKTIVLRFSNGVLDTTAAAKRHGVPDKDLVKALKESPVFRTRFVEAPASAKEDDGGAA